MDRIHCLKCVVTSYVEAGRPYISCRVRSNVVMRRVSCLELEVFGARAPVCKAEGVQIMNGFGDLVAFMSRATF